ncbi:MAG: hypothetical protein ABSG68_17380 [Thermoguttaceae bacterium]|jgi:hypothetical protein
MAKADGDSGPNPRVIREFHRFVERLAADVQGALDAAKARRLAPFEEVLRCGEYLLARYFAPVQGRALPKRILPKPPGLAVSVALAAGLKVIEPHLLEACMRQLQTVIEMLRPLDGKPFNRKAIMLSRTDEKPGKQAQRTVSEEDKALERLEQAGADIIHVFGVAVEKLTAQAIPCVKTRPVNRKIRRPGRLHRRSLPSRWGFIPTRSTLGFTVVNSA